MHDSSHGEKYHRSNSKRTYIHTYTGHGFRRTSTTTLADTGVGVDTLKRLGPWKSTSVCERYIQNYLAHKRKLGGLISSTINLPNHSKYEPIPMKKTATMPTPVYDFTADGSGMSSCDSGTVSRMPSCDSGTASSVSISGTSVSVCVGSPGAADCVKSTGPFPMTYKFYILLHYLMKLSR